MRQRRTKRGIERIAYSPSGRLLVGRDVQRNVQVWDAGTLEPGETIPPGDPREKLLDCLFRPGGPRFLREQGYVGAGQDLPGGAARPEHENLLRGLPGPAQEPGWSWTAHLRNLYPQHFACFGPDGQTFVGWHPTVEGSPVGLWRFNGELVRAFEWMSDWTVNDMDFSVGGNFLAAPYFSGPTGYEVALVDLRKEPPPRGVLYHTDTVTKVAWSPAAPLVACAARRSVWVWDAPAVIDPIAKSTGPWDAPTGVNPVHRFTGFRKTVEGLEFSPDGALLAAAAREGRMRIWEVASGREKADLDGKSGTLNHLAFSPDGSTVATACAKGIVVWDVE
jgi:WD40 repeat protein